MRKHLSTCSPLVLAVTSLLWFGCIARLPLESSCPRFNSFAADYNVSAAQRTSQVHFPLRIHYRSFGRNMDTTYSSRQELPSVSDAGANTSVLEQLSWPYFPVRTGGVGGGWRTRCRGQSCVLTTTPYVSGTITYSFVCVAGKWLLTEVAEWNEELG